MSSPITEVKPSQVAQLMKENKKLKEQLVDKDDEISCHCEQIEKLEEELNRYPEGAAGYTGDEFDELVSVMEDIENHPNYEECITSTIETAQKELKEEIEKLKEENYVLLGFQKEVDQMEAGLGEIGEDYEDMRYYDLPDVIKTLKEKNDELKQFAMKVHNFVYNTKYDDEDIVSSFDFDGILEEMKKDEDKLKEENEDNKLSISCLEAERDYVDPKGKFNYIDDYSDFNNHLKEKYNDDMYKKMYEWFDMDNMLDEDEE